MALGETNLCLMCWWNQWATQAVSSRAGEMIFFVMESKVIGQRFVLLMGTIVSCGFKCGFGNVYAPNADAERREFLNEVHAIISESDIPWCIAGDFNVVKSVEENIGLSFNQYAAADFVNFIDVCGFIDLPLVGGRFTWYSNWSPPTFSRLDRFLVSTDFLAKFPDVVQKLLPRSLSDRRKSIGDRCPFDFITTGLNLRGSKLWW